MADVTASPLVEFTGEESCSLQQVLMYAAMLVVALIVVVMLFRARDGFKPSQTKQLCKGALRPDWCSVARWAIPARQGHNDGNPSGPGINPVYCNDPTTGANYGGW